MPENFNSCYRTDGLLIDPQAGKIAKDDVCERLGPINMAVLQVLIANHGAVVSRQQIFDKVWKNQIVSDDALTRCISDLRSILKNLSATKLIETLPKRGYRWLAKVEIIQASTAHSEMKSIQIENAKTPETNHQTITAASFQRANLTRPAWQIFRLAGYLLGFMMMAAGLNWTLSYFSQSEPVRVALLPVSIGENVEQAVALQIEEILRNQLLATNDLRFLSASAVNIHPQTPYPNLAREFGTQWVIEGKIIKQNNQLRVSLNLVDAKTALVFHRFSREISNQPGQIEDYCRAFLTETHQVLGLIE